MDAKGLREFQIDLFRLGNKEHEFEFKISDSLFTSKSYSLIEKGSGSCKLILQKSETMMNLDFQIEVEVELICDRSLEPFIHPISLEEQLIIKFGEDDYILSEDVMVIKKDTPSINIGDFIYEFIAVAIPMKKLHPKFQDEDPEEEDATLIYSSSDETEEADEVSDPRWEALKKLKDTK